MGWDRFRSWEWVLERGRARLCWGEGGGGPCTAHVVLGKVPFEGEREEMWGGNGAVGFVPLTLTEGLHFAGSHWSFPQWRGIHGNKAPFRKFMTFFSMEKGRGGGEIVSRELSVASSFAPWAAWREPNPVESAGSSRGPRAPGSPRGRWDSGTEELWRLSSALARRARTCSSLPPALGPSASSEPPHLFCVTEGREGQLHLELQFKNGPASSPAEA